MAIGLCGFDKLCFQLLKVNPHQGRYKNGTEVSMERIC